VLVGWRRNLGGIMKLPRRQFLHLAAGTVALPAMPRTARAQAYPARPVRLIVGFAPGGPSDIAGRLISHWLSQRLGRQFIVENRPGGTSNVATESVIRSAPDGYTLLLATTANGINTTLYENLSFVFDRDVAPVGGILRVPNVLEVTPSFEVRTVPEFIAYAKANPGKINFVSGGVGTSQHVSGELFKVMAGVDMVHVAYRGSGPALTDLLAGQVQASFDALSSSIGYIRAGKLQALAVTTATRSQALPELPTIGDFVPGYEASAWFGVVAPKGTSGDIIDILSREINAAAADPDMRARLADLGGVPLAGSPSEFGKLITAETEKWGKVIRAANIKPE
jgi:tripartite-type tricarboxylate transporter receptor subunit TctC